jgi:hypothetical protein
VSYPNLALVGPAGAGKDSVAQILCDDYGYTRDAFKAPLHSLLLEIDPEYRDLVDRHGYEVAKREHGTRGRLVAVGNAVRRHVGIDTWAYSLTDRLDDADRHAKHHWVITDVRFSNEVQILADYGFSFIRVDRPGCSEWGLPRNPAVWHIHNNGTLGDLRLRVHALMSVIA